MASLYRHCHFIALHHFSHRYSQDVFSDLASLVVSQKNREARKVEGLEALDEGQALSASLV